MGETAIRRHQLDRQQFASLAAGGGDAGTIARLLAGERSWRLVQLRALLDATRSQPAAVGPLPPVARAWQLLVEAERRAPAEVDRLLRHPQAGTWAGYALRRLRGSATAAAPLWADIGYLHTLAAAAALRVGMDFRITVPVRDGYVVLPTLGAAEVPGASGNGWGQAEVGYAGGSGFIETTTGVVPVGGAGWIPLPTARAEAGGHAIAVTLDSLDPYRNLRTPIGPQPLPATAIDRWRELLVDAWRLLARAAPWMAPPMAEGLLSIVPQPEAEPFRTMSASAGDAFGSMIVSELRDATELAVTMVHEFQHIKLGAVLHQASLHDGQPAQRLYAPWRDDPRPLSGLLQGVYAFTGVTEFWSGMRRLAGAGALAQFEFARWRRQVWTVLADLAELPQLTTAGRALLAGLHATAQRWRGDEVTAAPRRAAAMATMDHRVRWRLHHLRPDPSLVASLATAWRRGASRPELSYPEPVVAADPAARGLDARAVLSIWRMADPDGFARLRAAPETVEVRVTGATAADVALVDGEYDRAGAAYLAELAADPDRPSSWAGLGLVLAAGSPGAAADALRVRPELVRAVHGAVRQAGGPPPDPVALAAWVGGG